MCSSHLSSFHHAACSDFRYPPSWPNFCIIFAFNAVKVWPQHCEGQLLSEAPKATGKETAYSWQDYIERLSLSAVTSWIFLEEYTVKSWTHLAICPRILPTAPKFSLGLSPSFSATSPSTQTAMTPSYLQIKACLYFVSTEHLLEHMIRQIAGREG